MKFIVVDDQEINLVIAKKLLIEVLNPDEIQTFIKAGEALRYLKTTAVRDCNEPITVLLDLEMPIISGLQFLDLFEEFEDTIKHNTHIYILTSSVNPSIRDQALQHANVISLVDKPLTEDFLIENFSGIRSTRS